MPCPRTQQANLPACSPRPPLNAEAKQIFYGYHVLKSFGTTLRRMWNHNQFELFTVKEHLLVAKKFLVNLSGS